MKSIKQMDEWLIKLADKKAQLKKGNKEQLVRMVEETGCPYLREKYQKSNH